jgi:hypothetical protein
MPTQTERVTVMKANRHLRCFGIQPIIAPESVSFWPTADQRCGIAGKLSTTAGAASVKAPTRLCSVKADERHDEQVQRNHASSLCQLPAAFWTLRH